MRGRIATPALVISLVLATSCDSRERDCASAKTALREHLEIETQEVLALAKDDAFFKPKPPSERDERARRIAENAGLDVETERPDIETARKELRAGVAEAQAKLTAWVDERFDSYCKALPDSEATCIADYDRWRAGLRKRQNRTCDKGDTKCRSKLRDEARTARPDCDRFDQHVDAFLAGAR
jgi:hypothetical protein